jgi:hypothetical protein
MKLRQQGAAAIAVAALWVVPLDAQTPVDSVRRQSRTLDSLPLSARTRQALTDSAAPAQAAQQPTGAFMNIGFVAIADFGWSSEPDVGALHLGDHDPKVRGFTIPNTELTLDGAVDPYFRGFANIVFKIDPEGESAFELEEAYVLTTSLPYNLQVKAGQFFAEFGRQNPQHPHSWAFVDQPLVLNRMFGPDGLRGQGARISWLAPTPWYTEVQVGALNSNGETMFSFRTEESSEIHGGIPAETGVNGGSDFAIVPRIAMSFDPTSTQSFLLGASAALGPNNSGPDASSAVYGADFYWKWKSASAQQGFPFVSLQTEALYRRYEAAAREAIDDPGLTLPAETLGDRGGYAQLLWGIKPRIVAGLRGEYAKGNEASFNSELRAERTRISPNLTWYPTEFSKLRLQYNHDDRTGIGRDHSVWLQFEFLLGAHAAHKF